MKRYAILLFLCLPSLSFGQSEEVLSFESTTYDFGTIPSSSKAQAKFLFTNTSDSSVEILKIHGGNHCIEIDTSSHRSYAPKEKGMISLTYDTSCKGPIRKTLSVFTSGKNNTITLKLTGKIED